MIDLGKFLKGTKEWRDAEKKLIGLEKSFAEYQVNEELQATFRHKQLQFPHYIFDRHKKQLLVHVGLVDEVATLLDVENVSVCTVPKKEIDFLHLVTVCDARNLVKYYYRRDEMLNEYVPQPSFLLLRRAMKILEAEIELQK